MPDQRLAQITLQKRMLDADRPLRSVAVAASGVVALLFLSPLQVAIYLGCHYLADAILTRAMAQLRAKPHSAFCLRAMQLSAFMAMTTFLLLPAMLWLEPGTTPKIGALIHIFGGMLSIMLVRAAFMPLTTANSLPLVGIVFVLAALEHGAIPWQEELLLGFAVSVLAGYFILTLKSALRINTELAGARDEALARVETQKRFLATMSHELRTPLNGILGTAHVISGSHPGIGAETIRDSARDMAAMVDDLLDIATIAAGALRINRKSVRLIEVMDRIRDRWDWQFAAKGLSLRIELAQDLPDAAMIDPLRLSQGLSNLLANALRLTSSGGVVLALTRRPGGLEAIVTDTGPGLPDGAEDRLFRPFETFGLQGGSSGPSTGLGLSITQGIARAMGGDLVFSRPREGGSCFRLTLAAADAVIINPTEPGEESTADADHLRDKRVLVVDDIATNRLVLQLLLRRAGALATEAASGAAALEMIANPDFDRPDVVLMDVRMPGLSGFDTLALARKAGLICPIIAVSADAAPAERVEAMAQGFDGYLTKPVEEADLRTALLRVMVEPVRL